MKILENFIERNILMIQEKGQIHMSIEEAEGVMKTLMYTKGPHTSKSARLNPRNRHKMNQNEVNQFKANATNSVRKEGIRPTTAGTFYSSRPGAGTTRSSTRQIKERIMTASNRSRLQSRQVRLESPSDPNLRGTMRGMFACSANELNIKSECLSNNVLTPDQYRNLNSTSFLKRLRLNNTVNSGRLTRTMRNYVKEELEGEKKKGIQLSPFDMKIYHKLNMLKDINPEKTNSTRDIRKLLHPTLRDDQLPTKDRNSHIKMSTLFSSKKKLKVPSKFYSRFVEFKKLPPSDFETPIIGNDSPYITEEDLKRKEYLQSKKGWISPETFRSYFSKATKSDNFIENYVTMTPSDPPILHKFRSAKKEDWLSHDFKF